MVRTKDTATFDAGAYEKTVRTMKERGEAVDSRGRETYQRTGQLDPLVNVFGQTRVSRNAFTKEKGDNVRLVHGPKLPFLSATDGTGSMGKNVAKAFYAMQLIDKMLRPIRVRYQTDLSFAVMQDVQDEHPPFQMPEFESDERAAEHIRLLVPDKDGGDPTEDYDLGLVYVRDRVETDISKLYGLKGYFLIVADQIGRRIVSPIGVRYHLGYTIQSAESTRDIATALLEKWHVYYVNVGSDGQRPLPKVSEWWEDKLGPGRVIEVPNADLLAEVQVGLVYVSETDQPSKDGLVEFLLAGGQNKRISQRDALEVWDWLKAAEQHFGAQARLPGYNEIPKPGDVFAHYRDPWPVDHPRASENPSQGGTPKPTASAPTTEPTKIDWNNF